ncbi:hypothetical protein GSF70_00410 [Flavobacteriaceae bacterium W22]|nr:hypothetical protein [Flavobacteriaceae bacterium W22]
MKNKIFILILSMMSVIGYAQCVPSATNPDSDGDGIANVCDLDDDNDGILDTVECPTVNNKPLFHLFDYTPTNLADPLWLYKQTNGIASAYVCASGTGCSTAPNGQPYLNANVTGTVDNLAYDDGKYYIINSAGNLLYSANIITGNFVNLGNANIGSGYKNLGYDNGVFYHWKRIGTTNNIELYRTTNPVSVPWTSLGTIVGGTYTFGTGGFNYLLKDIAVNDGVFYFLYDGTDVPTDESYSSVRSIVYSNSAPTTAASSWQNLGSANFGVDVYNIAYGSEDVLTLCDTDGDGIPNHLDLDSDNDGCPDAIEGGAAFTSTNLVNSSMSGGNSGATSGTFNQPVTQNLGNTVNTTSTSTSYGVPTVAGSGQTIGTAQTANPVLAAGTAGTNQTITSGSTPTALSLTGATGSVQWQLSNDNTTFTNISGATNTTYAPGTLTATRYYRAIVTSVGGCTSISNTVTITVNNPCLISATNPDSDGDGIADACDLDDDNDGILDCEENLLNRPVNEFFKINGNAQMVNSTEVRLTQNAQAQSGQLWSYGKTDFTKSFTISFQAYLGADNDGADGVAIVFHNDPAGVNATGEIGSGIGARGIQNGIVLELDTFENWWEPISDITADHGHIWRSSNQASLSTPVALPNLENGAWHAVIVTWNRSTNTLSYTVNGTLAGSYTGDVINSIFGGANKVFFGFTGSTGVFTNEQKVRFSQTCSLPFELDTDGDGIPNHLDLDSDNDGCPDAIEGGAAFTSANLVNSSMSGGNSGATNGAFNQPVTQNLGNTVNTTSTSTSYGVPTVAGSGQTIGTSQTANPVLAAGTAGANQTIISGSAPTALSLTGATGSIQWQVSTNNTLFTNISGATNATYAPGALTATRYYRAIVTSAGGCTAISNTVTVNITTPCSVSTLQPTVSGTLTNTCPANFADLNTTYSGTLPPDSEMKWFTNNTHSGTALTSVQVSKATAGTYYAFFYDTVNNCYSNASAPVTVTITPCCPSFTSYSTTGWSARVFDAPAGTDAWTEISNANNFPTSSYSQVATFNYNVKAGTSDAYSIDFQTLGTGLMPSNPQIQNYVGTQINNDPSWPVGDPRINEDYAVLFSKTVASGEEGTYQYDLTYGDDHIFIYKNGVKINQMDNAYYLYPFVNFATVNLAVGDVISVLMVEEFEFNTEVQISANKIPTVQNITNTCPSVTVNLNDAYTGNTAPGANLVWFNNNTHSGTALTAAQVANAGAGTYYAFYSNGSGCYSPASNAVTVTINSCVCYRDPVNNGTGSETKMGITLLKRAGSNDPSNWPMVRKSGHIALESNTQGFVVTRIAKADLGNITNPQEGMMVYDTTDKCLKIYSDNAWKCFSTPACPDESPIPPVVNPNTSPQT